jgi:xanthine dehydrogenase accessory factor
MASLIEEVVGVYRRGGEAVLVTLCSTKGSTPRKAGAKMLVYPRGKIKGTIGGGELEFEATKKALEIMKTKKSMLWEKRLIDLGMTLYLEHIGGEKQL